jgi:hypothetical protein
MCGLANPNQGGRSVHCLTGNGQAGGHSDFSMQREAAIYDILFKAETMIAIAADPCPGQCTYCGEQNSATLTMQKGACR